MRMPRAGPPPMVAGGRRPSPSLPWRQAVAVLVVAALTVGGVLAWQPVQRYVGVLPPRQFSRTDGIAGPASLPMFAVAHNAGNHPATVARAVARGAAVVEVDVISAGERLVAGREMRPWPALAEHLFAGETLGEMWQKIPASTAVMLDLKETDPTTLRHVADFVARRAGFRTVLVSAPDPAALRYLHERLPGVPLWLTIARPAARDRLYAGQLVAVATSGLSVHHGLIDRRLVGWAHARDLMVLAWTVNDGRRAASLARMHVDGVVTDNLAILSAARLRRPPR